MDEICGASLAELTAIAGFGAIVAQSVYDFCQEARNRQLLDKLTAVGVRPASSKRDVAAGGPLAGKTFVLTGRLEGMSRGEATARLLALGASVTSTVTKKTDYVVVGEEAGSKAARAVALKRPVLNEQEFQALLDNPGSAGGGEAGG